MAVADGEVNAATAEPWGTSATRQRTANTACKIRHPHGCGAAVPLLIALDALGAVAASAVVFLLFGRWLVPAVLPAAWLLALASQRAYEHGAGAEFFPRVLRAACLAAVAAGSLWWFIPRDELLHDAIIALLVTAVLTLGLRWYQEHWMRVGRGQGTHVDRVVVVGSARSSAELISVLRRSTGRRLQVVGACLTGPSPDDGGITQDVAVLGDVEDLPKVVRQVGCTEVVALPGPDLDAARLRRLSWDLQAEGVDLMLAPVLADVTAGRLSVRSVADVPLLQLRAPRLSTLPRIPKELTDRLLAALGLLLLSPLMLAIAVWVRLDSPGPAFFLHPRIGRNGREFTLWKFRTMRRDADRHKVEVAHLNQYGDDPFFKVADDPRVTRAGAFLRKYSLDELPQLFNVLAGHMSLVGPRPLVKEEVAALSADARHRLLVKPGLSGLWQVSGRSDLSSDERVRLDLSYVENWSPALDVAILLRTPAVIVHRTGAC